MVLHHLSTLLTIILFLFQPIVCIEFVYNSFNSSSLLLYGDATIQSSVLTLTHGGYGVSRAFYPQPILTRSPNSSYLLPFSTSFIFSISPPTQHDSNPRGVIFYFTPLPSSSYLNSVFLVRFYYFERPFNSWVNINNEQHDAGYWIDDDDTEFREVQLYNEKNYQVWIDYTNSYVNVTLAKAGTKRPNKPSITRFTNLSTTLPNQMYVGFSSSSDRTDEIKRILSWSFSNSNFSIGDSLITKNLPDFVTYDLVFRSKWFILGVSLGGILAILCGYLTCIMLIKRRRKIEELEDWESEYWPHRIDYQDIHRATKGFSEKNVIGQGGNGKVYKGLLQGGITVAIKRISLESVHGKKEFLAEVSSLGRLRHRNLVGLKGWSKTQTKGLMLVYDYMDCGSLDKWIFKTEENRMLDWHQRIKILTDVASGIAYLHEGWEAKVVHGDIKASNILLDKEMNARLGDFGLARVYFNEQSGDTTRVVGTVGYMAPELLRNGRASAPTDVFSFGIVILEIVCGRRSIEEGKQNLIDWVGQLMHEKKLVDALDESLKGNGMFCEDAEVEKLLQLGLWCSYPKPNARPSMRQVLKVLGGPTLMDDDVHINSTQNMVSTELPLLSSCVSLSDAILEGR